MRDFITYLIFGAVIWGVGSLTLRHIRSLFSAGVVGAASRLSWSELCDSQPIREMSDEESAAVQAFLCAWNMQLRDHGVRQLQGVLSATGDQASVDFIPLTLPFDSASFLQASDNQAEVVLTQGSALVLKLNGFDLLQACQSPQGEVAPTLLVAEREETPEEALFRVPVGPTTFDRAMLLALLFLLLVALGRTDSGEAWGIAGGVLVLSLALMGRSLYRRESRQRQRVRRYRGLWIESKRVKGDVEEYRYSLCGTLTVPVPPRLGMQSLLPPSGMEVEVELLADGSELLSISGHWSALEEHRNARPVFLGRALLLMLIAGIAWNFTDQHTPPVRQAAALAWNWLTDSQHTYRSLEAIVQSPPQAGDSVHFTVARGSCGMSWVQVHAFAANVPEVDCRVLLLGVLPDSEPPVSQELAELYYGTFIETKRATGLAIQLGIEGGDRARRSLGMNPPVGIVNLKQAVGALNALCARVGRSCEQAQEALLRYLHTFEGKRFAHWAELEAFTDERSSRPWLAIIFARDLASVRSTVRTLVEPLVTERIEGYIAEQRAAVQLVADEALLERAEGMDMKGDDITSPQVLQDFWDALREARQVGGQAPLAITGLVEAVEVRGESPTISIRMDPDLRLVDGRVFFFRLILLLLAASIFVLVAVSLGYRILRKTLVESHMPGHRG